MSCPTGLVRCPGPSAISRAFSDRVWLIHRRDLGTKGWDEQLTVPPVLVLDSTTGDLLNHWGGPGPGFDWPESEHGLSVTTDGHVWLQGGYPFTKGQGRNHHFPVNVTHDTFLLKFTTSGEFVMQLGRPFRERRP